MPRRSLTDTETESAARLKSIFNAKKKALQLTQEGAAHSLGWASAAAVSNYLNAKIALNLEAGLKFARLLKVAPSEINPAWAEYDVIHQDDENGGTRHDEIVAILDELSEEQLALLKQMAELLAGKK